MCSIRGLWLISIDSKVLFSRQFAAVEKRYESSCGGDGYLGLPNSQDMSRLFAEEIRDSVSHSGVVLGLNNDTVWPVVVTMKGNLCLVAVPCIEGLKGKAPLLELPAVTACVQLLEDLLHIVPRNYKEPSQVLEFAALISICMPLGTPSETSAKTLRGLLKSSYQPEVLSAVSDKRPAWRPLAPAGTLRVELLVSEEISAAQYDDEDVPDTHSVIGAVLCKAELPVNADLTVALNLTPPPPYYSVHPCVKTQGGVSLALMRCIPPLGIFPLCNYSGVRLPQLPIRGFYQMKELSNSECRLLLQLKLHESVPNSFDFCEALIPFTRRGDIAAVDCQPPCGTIAMTADKKNLVWNIGNKFTGKNLEIALQAKVKFSDKISSTDKPQTAGTTREEQPGGVSSPMGPQPSSQTTTLMADDDLFAAKENSYVKMRFKIEHHTFSGASVDQKGVSVSSQGKIQIVVDREVSAGDYLIWNSLGEVRHTAQPTADLLRVTS